MRFLTVLLVLAVVGCSTTSDKYESTWESLSKHEAEPEWLKDAKLGIYFHWGPYSVPAYCNEWYPRLMHMEEHHVGRHHAQKYGDPAEFGYHDFVPMFTAEKFDPEEWAELFQKAGARFAGPVAEHHDGFSMWNSKVTPWNAENMGPKRDILGELFQSLEKRNMKTIATFHHARNLQRYRDSWEQEDERGGDSRFSSSHFPYYPDWPTSSDDPELRLLYGNVPEEQWYEEIWLGKLTEVIDQYQPDIIWFDSWLDRIPETYRQRFAAYYLNAAEEWGRDVVIIRKQNDLPLDFSINDHEKTREPEVHPELWMTDDTISTGSWSYTDNLKIKPAYKVIHALIDTVSKNGVVLLNISPKADGSIPQDQRDVLLRLGKWLETNGEAIYDTRPWVIAAEGPTSSPGNTGFREHEKFLALEYSSKDIRYTVSKDGETVYAILLGVPETGKTIKLRAFTDVDAKVSMVETLDDLTVKWKRTENGVEITVPEGADKSQITSVYTITLK